MKLIVTGKTLGTNWGLGFIAVKKVVYRSPDPNDDIEYQWNCLLGIGGDAAYIYVNILWCEIKFDRQD